MIALCTGKPAVKVEDDRILVSLPSGKGQVQASLTLNQLLHLRAAIMGAMDEAFDTFASPATAELIAFPTREARHG